MNRNAAENKLKARSKKVNLMEDLKSEIMKDKDK